MARGCVVDVSRDGDTCGKGAWKTRSASVLWRRQGDSACTEKPVLQLEDETHRAPFLLHPRAGDGGKDFNSLHPNGRPCRHRDQAPEQASVQAPDGRHLKLRRQRLHQQQVQMITFYFCVFGLNLMCLRESAYSFGSRHSASHHHWLNEPCKIESCSSLVCAGNNSRYFFASA